MSRERPQAWPVAWGGGGGGCGAGGAHHLQLVLLQDLIQVLPFLVVEIEVLTLRHGLGAHHPGDGRPVPAMFQETWGRTAGEGYAHGLGVPTVPGSPDAKPEARCSGPNQRGCGWRARPPSAAWERPGLWALGGQMGAPPKCTPTKAAVQGPGSCGLRSGAQTPPGPPPLPRCSRDPALTHSRSCRQGLGRRGCFPAALGQGEEGAREPGGLGGSAESRWGRTGARSLHI